MNDPNYHDFLRLAFMQMKKQEIAFLKINENAHGMIYHQPNISQ